MKKRYILTSVLLCTFASVMAQTTNTEYFVSSSYTRTNLNPALRPANGYFGIPGLTNFSLDYKTNTFNLENFLFPGKGDEGKTATFLHKNVGIDEFLKNIVDANFLALDINETVLGFGFYAGDMFWNFDASIRVFSDFNIPGDFFSFVKKGLKSGQEFDFKDLSLSAAAFGQVALGASLPLLDDKLMVGAKAKVLVGLGAAGFNIDRLRFDLGKDNPDLWTLQTQASLQVHAPGVKAKYKEGEDGRLLFDGFNTDDLKATPSGWGLGVDLGGVFNLGYVSDALENISVSAAVTDIGFISWKKGEDNFVSMVSDPEQVTLLGDKNINFSNDSESLSKVFDGLIDKLDDVKNNLKEDPDAKTMKGMGLRSKMNIGIDYAFPDFPANVGILSTTHFNPSKTFTELTLGGSIRPIKKGLELGASYSMVYGNFQKFGLSLHLGNFFFISSDYLMPKINSEFLPVSVKGLNVQLGIAIPLGGPKKDRSLDVTPVTPKPKKEKPKKEDVPPVKIPVEAPIETPVEVPVETPEETPVINVLIEEPVTTTTTIQY